MVRRFAFALLAFGSLVSLPAVGSAQDVLSELYGRGVHAYFAGDSTGALTFLDDADKAGSTDPRVFYFRGLVKAGLGMTDEAVADFDKGANLEVTSKRAVEVGKALARIQGANRLQIEDARRKARLTAQANKAQILRDQYEAVKKSDAEMVRPAETTPPVVESKPAVVENDPFANPEKMKDGEPTVDENAPATPAPAADAADPFGDDAPAKPAAGGEEDPFGGSSGGSEKPAEDDPFGGN